MKKIIHLLGYPILGGLLFDISFLNLERVFSLDFGDIYVQIFFFYIVFAIFFVLFSKIKKTTFSKELTYIIRFILFTGILILPSFFINHLFLLEHLSETNLYLRVYGKIAMLYFALALSVSPILQFVKSNTWREHLILSRKILGIISFIFFLKHGLEYFAIEYIFQTQYSMDTPYFEYLYKNLIVRYDAITGIIAGLVMLVLGLTSNDISLDFLGGKKWKNLQKLVFPTFILSLLHIAFSSRFDGFYIFLIYLVVITRLVAYLNRAQRRSSGKIIGYRCIPCGYIYNEKVGDVDSGISPGTRFEDIPNDWRCPVCGVGKDDFEPIYEGEETLLNSKIVGYKMLTGDVLELKIKLNKKQKVSAGQFVNIVMKDSKGTFRRSYSVVKYKNNIFTFCIKLKSLGRGGEFLKKSSLGDNIKFGGVFGNFILNNTKNPKIFIATGTGLSPIMNMMSSVTKSSKNYLFFGVQKYKDLFYLDKINSIKRIQSKIFLSKENKKGFSFGRINLSKYSFPKNTEFYICGNPGLVSDTRKFLEKSGYAFIYSEEF